MTAGSHRAVRQSDRNTCTFGDDPIDGTYWWHCDRCGEYRVANTRHDLHLEVNAHINSETRR